MIQVGWIFDRRKVPRNTAQRRKDRREARHGRFTPPQLGSVSPDGQCHSFSFTWEGTNRARPMMIDENARMQA